MNYTEQNFTSPPATQDRLRAYLAQLEAAETAIRHLTCNPLNEVSPREMARMTGHIVHETERTLALLAP